MQFYFKSLLPEFHSIKMRSGARSYRWASSLHCLLSVNTKSCSNILRPGMGQADSESDTHFDSSLLSNWFSFSRWQFDIEKLFTLKLSRLFIDLSAKVCVLIQALMTLMIPLRIIFFIALLMFPLKLPFLNFNSDVPLLSLGELGFFAYQFNKKIFLYIFKNELKTI